MSKLTMRKISELLRQRFELHRSYREIGKSLNISISTVSDYLARAKLANLRWPLPEDLSEEALYRQLFLPVKSSTGERPAPDWSSIHQQLRQKGVTLRLLWREYREIHEQGWGYSQFCKRYQAYVKSIHPVMRQVYKGGEKSFVDYAGMTVPWHDLKTGECHQAQIFVGCLGASQFTFVEATASQQLPDWIQSHVHMWEYFGGVSAITVPDNLKAAVNKPHRYDPDINTNYQCLGEHYGFAIVPARVRKPRDKAKVENAVGCVERQILAPLRHRHFTSLAQINQAIKPLLHQLNHQPFQKMKTSRYALFEALDKSALKPLPATRYAYRQWVKAKVHIDYHVAFDDHYYSVPYRYLHQSIEICATHQTVECFYQGQRIATHQRSYRRYHFTTVKAHMPIAHQAQSDWSPERLVHWGNKIGPHTGAFLQEMMASRPFPQQAYRACLGVLRLGKHYGEARLEAACDYALTIGANRYQQVESILKNKLDQAHQEAKSAQTRPVSTHKNIRGTHYYH